uniref:NADH dehydrogenase subunit 2 n=1 Tax=Plectus acuminatus TaxID=70689 RepID=A0A1U7AFR0_PLEAC|nr:NADH dehydrogenase subunit 2 [Plectus acuminatus]
MMVMTLVMGVIIILSTSTVLLWWGVLLMMSVMFLAYIKHTEDSSLLKYFVIQEFAGMILGLLLLAGYQGMLINILLMIKLAVAPFHFWLITAIEHMSDLAFSWATTFQKLPAALMLLQLMNPSTMSLLALGTMYSVLHLFTMTTAKGIILVSSTTTIGWILFLQAKNWMSSAFILIMYLLLMMLILTMTNSKSIETSMSLIITLLNWPLSIIFIIKATFFMNLSEVSIIFAIISLWSAYIGAVSYFSMLTNLIKVQEDFSFPMSKLYYAFNLLTLFLLIR